MNRLCNNNTMDEALLKTSEFIRKINAYDALKMPPPFYYQFNNKAIMTSQLFEKLCWVLNHKDKILTKLVN